MLEALAVVVLSAFNSYHIGNSLMADGTVWLGSVAEQAGEVEYTYGIHIDSNQSLDTIWNTPGGVGGVDLTNPPYGRWDNALATYHWDHLVLEPWYGAGATLASQKQAIANFIDYTRENPANASTIYYVYQFWPLKSLGNYSAYWTDLPNPTDATVMYPRAANYRYLMDWARSTYLPQGIVVREIPTGEVWHQVSLAIEAGEISGITMADLYRDDLHASWHLGRYLATATTYATLRQTDIAGVSAPPEFLQFYPQSLYDQLNAIAWRVISGDPDTGIADFNDDGWVDGADLSTWSSAYGQSASGDTDGDSDTDGRDFLNWQKNYRATNPSESTLSFAVPEPATFIMAIIAMGLAACSLHRRAG